MNPRLEINSRCIQCDNCRIICPENAVLKVSHDYYIEPWACTFCHLCIEVCPVDCIKLSTPEQTA